MADKNAKKKEFEPNEAETKRSEPNWHIYILILNILFSPFDFQLLTFDF